ncbi:cysteine proteinase [Coprinellus micaceus]|uniref:ubiquitinyl hydrolase 1 n=1 Tax=Coprinellus micaceus TaxID=71717 RepID=A0A4Y7SXM9_COPMI|nr:cysteine proteinase [Coprinellus micaceus]
MTIGAKRRRRASPAGKAAPAEQMLKRFTLPKGTSGPWSWVGTDVTTLDAITRTHQLAAYGFDSTSGFSACENKYPAPKLTTDATGSSQSQASDEDVIIVSDDRDGPGLLQEELQSQSSVWFRDIAFRNGVYQCEVPEGDRERLKDSPIFQLQVTFAALQESKESVFNPSKLVESLQLRTSEQQDAQEFSKLFMSHLDAEFKEQADPAVKMLIESQFQGSQVYGTYCHACQYKSERSSDFLEVEVNFNGPSKLEERIAASLEPEVLSGDNKYHCPKCDCLQDATRFTELRQLPPVLHFSLLRFVYNLDTMERKKQKHAISFPTVLDMSQFLGGHSATTLSEVTSARQEDCIYELRGILLHKGSSAYHGHYEAQVLDPELASWFQFNDETVTKVSSLGDHLKGGGDAAEASKEKRPKGRPKKRRRIEDSSDERPSPTPGSSQSKDAYMLVYARKDHGKGYVPRDPPAIASKVVNDLNVTHEKTCEEYERQDDSTKAAFEERLQRVRAIYNHWQAVEDAEDAIVVSEHGLRAWLSESWYAGIASVPQDGPSLVGCTRRSISNGDILCEHNKLCPGKAAETKVLSRRAYEEITANTFCDFDPLLTVADVCDTCIGREFKERLYDIRHTHLVKEFEQAERSQDEDQNDGFWISKQWLKDWKSNKPRMHVYSEEDPPPDAPNFCGDVGERPRNSCYLYFHPGNRRLRRRKPALFARLRPSISKEDKKDLRKKAEEEKSKLKFMHSITYAFFSGTPPPLCAVIPSTFYRAWKRWVDSPTSHPRPTAVDNSQFLCESHSLLLYDPNCSEEIESTITVIRRDEWDELVLLYPASPLIALHKNDDGVYKPDVPICSECRTKRQKYWDVTDIVVQLGPVPGKESSRNPSRSNGASATRHSRRLRKKQGDRRKITVRKGTSVREMKVQISEAYEIPTICQKLFLHGAELNDNEATAESLDLLAHDVLELHHVTEEIDVDGISDSEADRKKPRDEGRGFNGTVLGGAGWTTDSSMPSSPAATPDQITLVDSKPCNACTFSNSADALSCEICDTIFV